VRTGSAPLSFRHRLFVAGATTFAFHAVVFGVVEWRLSVAADATPETPVPMTVTVRLDEYRPEPPSPAPAVDPGTEVPARRAPEATEASMPARSIPSEQLPVPVEGAAAGSAEPPPADPPAPQPVGATRSVEAGDPRLPTPTPGEVPEVESPPDGVPGAAPSGMTAPPSIPTYETVRYTPPSYPEAARRAGQTGTVELVLTLSRRGTVTDVTVHRSSSVPELDRAAVRAAATWRFPRGEAGRRSIHRIRFDLEERK
jgi:protein TonB